ncbi:TlpA family protein disulfide reductase [Fodinibius salsisoli]|uniref:TlpA family protein disulfide reductase n=1 Tax=Fodinibius salsisoli TaxID=2820877 RepID=A0ABT3PSW7_9BACT|nr:TlpA disulfide reductase family protein [Fodinibius salsisoli]MCW9708948.1 TlpA family protein disulfide reductase [Fodinibius salsisoli]
MYQEKILLLFIILFLCLACNKEKVQTPSVTATVIDHQGNSLSNFSLQLIDAAETWTGKPFVAKVSDNTNTITTNLPTNRPVVLRFGAPGYQPLFTFLMPVDKAVKMKVKLGAPTKIPNSKPVLVGNFNNFDAQSGKQMVQKNDGSWSTEIRSTTDTLNYAISHYIFGATIAGTQGSYRFQKESRGPETSFTNTITRSSEDSTFHIRFNPKAYQAIFNSAKPEISFISQIPASVEGIAKIYTAMTKKFADDITSRYLSKLGQNETEASSPSFKEKLVSIEQEYDETAVSHASDIAKLRISGSDAMSVPEAESLLQSIAADSPLWLIHFPALTSAVNRVGLKNSFEPISRIAEETPYKDLQGEALFNRLRYYYEQKAEAKWYATFTELVSNHPDHFRTPYAYKKYAPSQPISKGNPLPFDHFNGLTEDTSINLSDLEESYLLIDFWATWCGPCIKSLPELQKIHNQFSNKDFAIVSISLDDSPQEVIRFKNSKMAMPWYHAYQKRGSKKIRKMGITSIPHYLLLGPDRNVIISDQTKLKGDSLAKTLSRYL